MFVVGNPEVINVYYMNQLEICIFEIIFISVAIIVSHRNYTVRHVFLSCSLQLVFMLHSVVREGTLSFE